MTEPQTPQLYQIAIPSPLEQSFTYSSQAEIPEGSRVIVPFGPRKVIGVTIAKTTDKPAPGIKIKAIDSIVDKTPIYSANMLKLANWMSIYYWHSLGDILKTMLPASKQKQNKLTYTLTEKGETEMLSGSPDFGALLKAIFARKSSLGKATARIKYKKLLEVNPAWSQISLEMLVKKKFISVTQEKTLKARHSDEVIIDSPVSQAVNTDNKVALTSDQTNVLERLYSAATAQAGSIKPHLLHGITGAGKTEVYLNLIEKLCYEITGDAQALVLVPEISLTPQMTKVFTERFPGSVAVVHSNLSDQHRWQELEKIHKGEAKILIGPRSAVFAPFLNLKLIIVDEEHDSSYKQQSGVAYHGRDVAIVRAQYEKALIVLGSATPAMETYYNAKNGKYEYLQLNKRISKHPLPKIRCVALAKNKKSVDIVKNSSQGVSTISTSEDELVSPHIIEAMKTELTQGRQVMVIVNRRGYAPYLFCADTRQPVLCPNCSISMSLHHGAKSLQCHYCGIHKNVQEVLKENPAYTYLAIGFGSQKAEEALIKLLPEHKIVRVDSDLTMKRDYLETVLRDFRERKTDVLVGTQILAKGHDFPNVSLIAILEVDQILDLPDFRAGERTFQLIVQAAGRAGRGDIPGQILMQTLQPGHYVIQDAIEQNYQDFAEKELAFRKKFLYPPYSKQIAIELSSPQEFRLNEICRKINYWKDHLFTHQPELAETTSLNGPCKPPLEFVRNRHRRVLLLTSSDFTTLRKLTKMFLEAFADLPSSVRMNIDADPQDLL